MDDYPYYGHEDEYSSYDNDSYDFNPDDFESDYWEDSSYRYTDQVDTNEYDQDYIEPQEYKEYDDLAEDLYEVYEAYNFFSDDEMDEDKIAAEYEEYLAQKKTGISYRPENTPQIKYYKSQDKTPISDNSKAIIIFCSGLCAKEGIKPLTANEWSKLAEKMMKFGDLMPEDLLSFNERDFVDILNFSEEGAQRMMRLIDRSFSIAEEIVDYESKGIQIITRADERYPKQLKAKLKHLCPPIFYCAGDLSILHRKSVGYVGSREFTSDDHKFTIDTVHKTLSNDYAVVSGGANGVDDIASREALLNGGYAIEYLVAPFYNKMEDSVLLEAMQDGHLLLMTSVTPVGPCKKDFSMGKLVGDLMERNKYIYAQSAATVIVHSQDSGLILSGANENLKYRWTPALCWNKSDYKSNQELIRLGCIPIDETWDGNPVHIERKQTRETYAQEYIPEQLQIPGFAMEKEIHLL